MSNKSSGADTDGVVYLRSALWVAGEVRARIAYGLWIVNWEKAKQELRVVWIPALRTSKNVDILGLDNQLF